MARGARFYLLAYLLRSYGIQVTQFIEQRLAQVMAGVVVVAGLVWLGSKFV